ncbi:hypothetical protein, partial [Vibrio anguillarum]
GEFKPSSDNFALLTPSLSKPTNLIHLGLLLGFFDNTDKAVRVTPDTPGAYYSPNPQGKAKYLKPIIKLSLLDKLSMIGKCATVSALLGKSIASKLDYVKYSAGKKVLTVAEFQNHFVQINQKYLSGYNKNQTKQIDYENALFTFTEQQLKANKSSHFILIPLSSLNNLYYQCLKKQKGSTKKTIFERHNFSSEFFIKPHQLRHWQNDYLAKKGVPHQVISMLSGRKSAEQTLSYIHITDAQNSSVI